MAATNYQQPMMGDAGGQGPPPQAMSLDLTRVNNVVVTQSKKGCLWETFCFETESEYRISTLEQRENVFMYAKEQSSWITRCLFANLRSLDVDITVGDQPGGPVLSRYVRPLRFPAGCCCFVQEMQTFSNNAPAGKTEIPFYFCGPEMDVFDGMGQQTYKIKGPAFNCGRPHFDIHQGTSVDGPVVGTIQKEWGGLAKECCTDADTFSIVFPASADAGARANLIGSTFLLDYNWFEHSKNGNEAF